MDNYYSIIPITGFSEPVSCWSQFLAAGAFLAGTVYLLRKGRGNGLRVSALSIYSFCAIYLFAMSGVYHLLEPGGLPRAVFQRLDHAAIWTMIAGTFTAIHVLLFRGIWRWGILLVIWSVAITGLVLEVVFFRDFPEWLSLTLYLGLGWVGLLSGYAFIRNYRGEQVRDLLFGGIAYSLGAIMEYLRWPTLIPGVVGPHEIFHLFVIAAALFHWRFIAAFADLALKKHLTLIVKVRPGNVFDVRARDENIKFCADSRQDMYGKLRAAINAKYRERYRPHSIRLKYFEEEFVDPQAGPSTTARPDLKVAADQ